MPTRSAERGVTLPATQDPTKLDVFTTGAAPAWLRRWAQRMGMPLTVHRLHRNPGPLPITIDLDRLDRLHDHWVFLNRGTASPRGSVVVALSGLPSDDAALVAAVLIATELHADLTITHAVPLSYGERSIGLNEAVAHGHDLLHTAHRRASSLSPGLQVGHRLVRARAEELVTAPGGAALLVLGRPPRLSGTGHGLVTTTAIADAACPLLLVPCAGPAGRGAGWHEPL